VVGRSTTTWAARSESASAPVPEMTMSAEPEFPTAGHRNRTMNLTRRQKVRPPLAEGDMDYVAAMDLQQLSDRAEINDLMIRYNESLNSADWESWSACFTADARVDYTTAGGIAGTVAEAATWLAETMVAFDMRIGRIANVLPTFTGADSATVSSQYSMTMRIAGEPPTYIDAAGWYDDEVVRTADGWRIASRHERIAFMRM
jgi:3-phenylpropionate/cinnamic acid dioxygenase small subunit